VSNGTGEYIHPTEEQLLELYGLYKQSNFGKCNTSSPWFWDFANKKKWDSWNKLGDMDEVVAMKLYIELLDTIEPEWHDIQIRHSWMNVSRPINEEIEEEDKTIFYFISNGQMDKVDEIISSNPETINLSDEEQRTLLHWAVDSGNIELTIRLISLGLDVNKKDISGQTPLHYAATCEHEEIIKILLENGADVNIKDNEGEVPSLK